MTMEKNTETKGLIVVALGTGTILASKILSEGWFAGIRRENVGIHGWRKEEAV